MYYRVNVFYNKCSINNIFLRYFVLLFHRLYHDNIRYWQYIAMCFTLLCYIVIVQRSWNRTTSSDRAQSYENSSDDSFRIKGNSETKFEKTCGRILRAALSIREAPWRQTQTEELTGRLIKLICSINTFVGLRASLLHVCPPQRSWFERSCTMAD